MPGPRRFEDLRCWQEARSLVREVYSLTQSGPIRSQYPLRDQLQRAALSTMTNIAEGFGRYSNREFQRFLLYSRGSCTELRSLIYAGIDLGYLASAEAVLGQAETLERSIGGLLRALRRRLQE